jgi:hypothetical protein
VSTHPKENVMDVTKNIKDAGYIAVGAGVIGFQQAQVRRREIGSEVARRAQGARTCAEHQLESLRKQVATQSATVRTSVEDQALGAWELANIGISGVTSGITGTASGFAGTASGLAGTATGFAGTATDAAAGLADDVREIVEPVVGEAKVRVEPLVEQLQAVPDHVVRAVDAGRTKVLGMVGSGTGSPASAA